MPVCGIARPRHIGRAHQRSTPPARIRTSRLRRWRCAESYDETSVFGEVRSSRLIEPAHQGARVGCRPASLLGPRGCSSVGRALRSQRRSRRFESAHLHRKLWIFASFGLTVLGFHAVPWHSHGVVHRVYGLVYRLLITVPYAALRTGSGRHTGRTLGFRGRSSRRRVLRPGLPYAALPQHGAVRYSTRWAEGGALWVAAGGQGGGDASRVGQRCHRCGVWSVVMGCGS